MNNMINALTSLGTGRTTRRILALAATTVGMLILSGAAHAISFTGSLSGAAESPPNASPGTGLTSVTYDPATHLLTVSVAFSGLQSGTTAAHIHCCTTSPGTGTAGVATQVPTFVNFPLGVTSGNYAQTFDLTLAASWNPAFIAANGGTPASAEAALAAGLSSGRAYLNIHTTLFPGGEIRAFLITLETTQVPTLTSWSIGALALVLLLAGFVHWRRSRA